MFLHMEQHLHWTMPGGLQVKGCSVHGSVMNVLVFLELRRPKRSFSLPWTQVRCLNRNDPGFLTASEQVSILSISHTEVLNSGHVYVDVHVLERYLFP